jgi:hypothetical protein
LQFFFLIMLWFQCFHPMTSIAILAQS